MNLGDLKDDAEILLGKTNVQDKAVNDLFKLLDEHNVHFDVAGHSLGTEFIMNGLQKDEYVDKIMLFNPASSGLQDSKLLNERANNPKYSYFINGSDVVSHGIYQQMSNEKIKESVISV